MERGMEGEKEGETNTEGKREERIVSGEQWKREKGRLGEMERGKELR